MIIRKQQIRQTSEEISMQVSYGLPDVKKAMQSYYHGLADICGDDFAITDPQTEPDVRYYLEHATFANYDEKYREQLSAWCFSMAVKHRLLIPSCDEENKIRKVYFHSDKLRRKAGRPRKEDKY